jgi:hypothetical protein
MIRIWTGQWTNIVIHIVIALFFLDTISEIDNFLIHICYLVNCIYLCGIAFKNRVKVKN